MIYAIRLYCIYISAGSTLLVLTGWAMREPLNVERVTDTDSTLFYFQRLHIARESAEKTKVMNRDDFLKTERLYHFTKYENAYSILQSRTLNFSKLNRMNDINESCRQIFTNNGIEPKEVENEISKYKQISLTHDGKFPGFAIPSMWGHYAEKGNGICIVFDKTKLLKNVPDECYKNNISYNPDYCSDIVVNKNVEAYFNKHIHDLFFIKTVDWEHEQEYRIITKEEDSIDVDSCVLAIIMCMTDGVEYGDSIWGADSVKKFQTEFPKIFILEFNYWSGLPLLRNEQCEQWYPYPKIPV